MTSGAAAPQSTRWKWITVILTVGIAIATFEPHFETFDFVIYLLRTFLPELTLAALVIFFLAAARSGVMVLIGRHRLMFACFILALFLLTDGCMEREQRNASGAANTEVEQFTAEPKRQFWRWIKNRDDAYSTDQVRFFRDDMKFQAVEAFEKQDVAGAVGYLRAWNGIFPQRLAEDSQPQTAMNFLVSRERYIANHKARIIRLGVHFPLAPARLYMMRVVSQLERGDQDDPELFALRSRIHIAGTEADKLLSNCLLGKPINAASVDTRQLINLTIEALGTAETWRESQSAEQWCTTLRADISGRQDPTAFRNSFGVLARNLWGSALDPPENESISQSSSRTDVSADVEGEPED